MISTMQEMLAMVLNPEKLVTVLNSVSANNIEYTIDSQAILSDYRPWIDEGLILLTMQLCLRDISTLAKRYSKSVYLEEDEDLAGVNIVLDFYGLVIPAHTAMSFDYYSPDCNFSIEFADDFLKDVIRITIADAGSYLTEVIE